MATLVDAALDGDVLDSRLALLITDGGRTLTRGQLRREVEGAAEQLHALGVGRGTVVALALANTLELVTLFLAATRLGAIAAPLNPAYALDDFTFSLEDASVKLLIVPLHGCDSAERAALALHVAVVSAAADKERGTVVSPRARCSSVAPGPPALLPAAQPEDVALFLHTSGTTAKPKGVPLTHANMIASMRNIAASYDLSALDRSYIVMPLFHVHGLMSALFAALYAGGSVVLPSRGLGFQADAFWRHVAQYRCTWYTAVPSMHVTLLANVALFEAAKRPPLRFIRSCSSSLPPSVCVQLEQTFAAPVLEAYAMTEACHQMCSNPLPSRGARKPGSVGLPTGVDVLVVDEREQPVAAGGVGELCVRGPNVMKGYHNRPAANAESFLANGFFRTGDLATRDADGYVFLIGRIKEQINRGGEKISPVAIDNALLKCLQGTVRALFAFAVPSEELGEAVGVACELAAGAELSLPQLNRLAMNAVSPQWLPQVLVVCSAVPKGPTGKVQRTKLASTLGVPALRAGQGPQEYRFELGQGLLQQQQSAAPKPAAVAAATGLLSVDVLAGIMEQVLAVELRDHSMPVALDSFNAVRLSAELKRVGYSVASSQLVHKPLSVGDVAAMLNAVPAELRGPEAAPDWAALCTLPQDLQQQLQQQQQQQQRSVSRRAGRSVLLTGATGFLGVHIIATLTELGAQRVWCLVRDHDELEGRARLEAQWRAQALGEQLPACVSTVRGDVSAEYWGLTEEAVRLLRESGVAAVVHNAAFVNHALPFAALQQHNVQSVLWGLRLALKLDAYLAFVSTAGVCGRVAFPTAASPERLPASALGAATGYVQGKWVAEMLLQHAYALCPGVCGVFRPGAVTGHARTGACNLGDTINRLLIGFALLKEAPPLDPAVQVDMSPVDYVAGAIARLSWHHSVGEGAAAAANMAVYTLDNIHSLPYGQLVPALNEVLADPIRISDSYGAWLSVLHAALDDDKAPVNPLRDLHGALSLKEPLFGTSACVQHAALLASLGCPAPTVDVQLLRVYFRWFAQHYALVVK